VPRGRAAAVAVAVVVLVAAATSTLVAPRAARADSQIDALLDEARRHKAALDYPRALEALDRALRLGRSGPSDLTAIHRLAGELAGGLDDPAAAQRHFEHLLSLDPSATLPDGTSPKIVAPFDAARRALGDRRLTVRFDATWIDRPLVTLIVIDDPTSLVVGLRVRARHGVPQPLDAFDDELLARGTPRVTIDVAASPRGRPLVEGRADRTELILSAVDEHGNDLFLAGAPYSPLVLRRPDAPPEPRPLFLRWWVWGAASLVLATTGVLFALDVRAAEDEFDDITSDLMHDLDDAEAVRDRGERSALFANVAFVLAGGTAIVSTFLFFAERQDEANRRRRRDVTLTPIATPDGARAVLRVSF
jgi:tetratricopeptide (TPR) repeat protein